MTYPESLEYLASLAPRGWRLGLDRMQAFADAAGIQAGKGGAPRYIHVAGTNGKGSVTAFCQGILYEQGYRVGAFFSPYVIDPRERIQLGVDLIKPDDFARVCTELLEPAHAVEEEFGGVTEFELKTAMGFKFWEQQGCDWVALEVGLGGRLDATNIVHPACTVIVSISLDHTNILGNTLEEIAREKAGIIKPGVPVVIGQMADGPLEVILAIAKAVGAPAYVYGRDFGAEIIGSPSPPNPLSPVIGEGDENFPPLEGWPESTSTAPVGHLPLTPRGRIGKASDPSFPCEQSSEGEVAQPAGATVEVLKVHGTSPPGPFSPTKGEGDLNSPPVEGWPAMPGGVVTADEIRRHNMALAAMACHLSGALKDWSKVPDSLAKSKLPGRMTPIQMGNLEGIADGAHNPSSAQILANSLKEKGSVTFLTGMVHGHDPVEFYRHLAPKAHHFVLCPIDNPRAYDPNDLAEKLEPLGVPITVCKSLEQALEACQKIGRKLVVTGSFYLVGEVLRHPRVQTK